MAPELRPYSGAPCVCSVNSRLHHRKQSRRRSGHAALIEEGLLRNESLLSTPSMRKMLAFSRWPLTVNDPSEPLRTRRRCRKQDRQTAEIATVIGSSSICRLLTTSASALVFDCRSGMATTSTVSGTSDLQNTVVRELSGNRDSMPSPRRAKALPLSLERYLPGGRSVSVNRPFATGRRLPFQTGRRARNPNSHVRHNGACGVRDCTAERRAVRLRASDKVRLRLQQNHDETPAPSTPPAPIETPFEEKTRKVDIAREAS